MHEDTPAGAQPGYRPYFDGIRTVAVATVLAFHAGIPEFAGGFVGVDVFFVLSGYLVTGVLLTGILTDGRVRFRRFYARRVRRLLPLAILVLVVTAVVFTALASPLVVVEARGSFTAAFLYVANWWFIAESTEYLGSNLEASPILHFWSLAIEEQFYFVWPLALHGAYRLAQRVTARPFRLLAAAAIGLGVVSFGAALVLGADDIDRAYYGTDTRAYQLLLGAALALLPRLAGSDAVRRSAGRAAAFASFGVLVLATDLLDLSPIVRGAWTAAATGVALVALEAGAAPRLSAALSHRVLVALGVRSYGIYLWHLPVLFVLGDQWDLGPWASLVVAAPVSVLLAESSARLLESPVRHTPRLDSVPRSVVVAGLSLSLVAGLLVPSLLLSPSTSSAVALPVPNAEPDSTPPADEVPATVTFDWEAIREDRGESPDCGAADPSRCTVRTGSGPHILLIGDSHAKVWQSAFEIVAEERGNTLSVASFPRCSWHLDTMVAFDPDAQQDCYRRQHEWVDVVVPALRPDVVVLIHRATFDAAQPFLADLQRFTDATDLTVEELLKTAGSVVLLEPTPLTSPDDDPLACLADGGTVQDCSFDATPGPTALEAHYRSLAAAVDGVFSVDLDQLACPRLPRCDAIVGETVVWRDNSHMTATYARTLAPAIIADGFLDVVRASG